MATVSFEKSFVVKDKQLIEQLHYDLEHPRKVQIANRDLKADSKRGIALLRQRLYR